MLEKYLQMFGKSGRTRNVNPDKLTGGMEGDNISETDYCLMEVLKAWERSVESSLILGCATESLS